MKTNHDDPMIPHLKESGQTIGVSESGATGGFNPLGLWSCGIRVFEAGGIV